MKEVWKDIPGYEGYYQVSNLGGVRSLPRTVPMLDGRTYKVRGGMLKVGIGNNGYCFVSLSGHKGEKQETLHRIVLEAFVGQCPQGMEGCHEDHNRTNNRLNNLKWDTHRNNMQSLIRASSDKTFIEQQVKLYRKEIEVWNRKAKLQKPEVWKDIPGYGTAYQVSNQGRVKKRGRLLEPMKGDRHGHLAVTLWGESRYIHQLVLIAFIGPRPEGKQACHFPDPNPANNCLENLRWGTPQENRIQSIAHGRTGQKGAANGNSKLSEETIQTIRELYSRGELSQKAIGGLFNVNQQSISMIVCRRTWKHIS